MYEKGVEGGRGRRGRRRRRGRRGWMYEKGVEGGSEGGGGLAGTPPSSQGSLMVPRRRRAENCEA